MRYRRIGWLSAVAVSGLGAASLAITTSASAVTAPLSDVREVAHFNISTQQQPENITLEPGGAADVTFNKARQVARVGTDGSVTILATLPASSTGIALATGIVRAVDGTLYVGYDAGSQSGIWRISADGRTAVPIVALPDVIALNGLALDQGQDALYATDSTDGTVWKVSLRSGTASIWAQGTALQPTSSTGKGANGIKVHDDAVWVSNTQQGTLMRIPIDAHGAAGAITTVAQGVTGIDDFAFTGQGDTVLAAQDPISQASIVYPDGTHQTVLTAADGLSNPTSVAVRGSTVYITSGAYFTQVDPNLLLAKLGD
jgi:sugar lactone lactonase YvrE